MSKRRQVAATRDVVQSMISQDREGHLRTRIRELEAEVERLKGEINDLHVAYGVVAAPERTFQGPCGHLWDYGPTRKTCPHCADLDRLGEAAAARTRRIEILGGLLEAAQKTIDELKSRPLDPVYERARKAEADVERLKKVVAAQDELLAYRADVIAGRLIEYPEPKEWR